MEDKQEQQFSEFGNDDADIAAVSSEINSMTAQYTKEDIRRAVEVFEMLARWCEEDRKKGLIDW